MGSTGSSAPGHYTQEGRLISLTTPLGENKLLLTGLSGHEAISRLFDFHLTTLSEDTDIDFTSIIGQGVTINITQSDNSQRYFNGIVSHFACTGKEGDMTRYELEVVPKLWTLTRYADCRIFHNMLVTEIIEQVLDERGINYNPALSGDYKPLEYCVQYRETDFNFVSRLMEQFGIFYFFEHEDGDHTMKLGDSSSLHNPCPGQATAGFNLATGGLDAGDAVNDLSIGQEMRSGKHSVTDYNFTTSTQDLSATESTIYSVAGNDDMEIFDYPGLHTTPSDGTALVRVRMQEEEAVHKIVHGSSVCRAFTSGYKFDLEDHPLPAMNASYLLTEIQHVASVAGTYRDAGAGGGDSYVNHFTCIPADVPFRPARLTPKPFVQGPQTATVVGKSADDDSADDDNAGGDGEEIWVDKWGRVLVQFPWDRKRATSCWMRVSQDWAGQGWGMINIPRVGQEVIVSFLEGDPDRPIITGRVYNDVQTVPYTLPDNGTRTTFKTHSSPGGGDDNYNELRFEDKKGSEDLLIHAERTMHNSVEASQYITVGGSRHITTGGVDKDGNKLGDVKELVFKNHNLHVQGDDKIKIEGQSHAHVMDQADAIYDKDLVLSVNQKCVILADTLQLQGTTKIVLIAGSSSLVIDASGVTVLGTPMINLNTPGAPPTPEIIPLTVDPDDP
jgi:type VI secretion system secreted protein VgrG